MIRTLFIAIVAAAIVSFSTASASAAIGSAADMALDRIAVGPIECAQAGVPIGDSLFPAGFCTPIGVPVPPTMVA
jgi:hypothetical protein